MKHSDAEKGTKGDTMKNGRTLMKESGI